MTLGTKTPFCANGLSCIPLLRPERAGVGTGTLERQDGHCSLQNSLDHVALKVRGASRSCSAGAPLGFVP